MKTKLLTLLIIGCLSSNITFGQDNSQQETSPKKTKTGWNLGVLPSVSYDADLGFQYGALTNIYNYGDGKIYPEYYHSIYLEASYTTKRNGTFRASYDSRYLIPNHRFTVDITYIPDAMWDFYGFNGYTSVYQRDWHDDSNKDGKYVSRAFYKNNRKLFRTSIDIDGKIANNLNWNAGIGILNYNIKNVDVDFLNKGKSEENMLPHTDGLYQKYIDWNIIKPNEMNGGFHPYIHLGLTYDSRDITACPTKGIHADAFFTYNAAFKEQKEYNNLKFNFNFRHYIPLYTNKVVFAYRLSTQNTIAGKSPFYLNTFHNTIFFKRAIYEALGGSNSLRGISRNRILSEGFALANVELRLRIFDFTIGKQFFYIGLNPFIDMGMVTQAYDLNEGDIQQAIDHNNSVKGIDDRIEDYFNFDKSLVHKPHISGGLGLKAAMNENFILSVDCATPFNEQDNSNKVNIYIKIGYLF